jgi:hypothetical protein
LPTAPKRTVPVGAGAGAVVDVVVGAGAVVVVVVCLRTRASAASEPMVPLTTLTIPTNVAAATNFLNSFPLTSQLIDNADQ